MQYVGVAVHGGAKLGKGCNVAALDALDLDDDEEKDKDKARLERRVYLNLLYDCYSPLLTERQRDVYEMLHFLDLAPTEVAQALKVSRQSVHILERRVVERLEKIEGELHFAATVRRLEERIRELEEVVRSHVRCPEG